MFVVGMVIAAVVVIGGIQIYWGILGGVLVAISMQIRQYAEGHHSDKLVS